MVMTAGADALAIGAAKVSGTDVNAVGSVSDYPAIILLTQSSSGIGLMRGPG